MESQISRNRVKEENVFKEYLFLFSFLFFLSFFLLWSGSGTSREVVSALNSRADVTSLLAIASSFFLVSPFVLTDFGSQKTWVFISLHRLQIRYSKILLILARLLPIGYFTFYYFSFFWFLTGWMRGALCIATRLYILYLAADESISGWEFYC